MPIKISVKMEDKTFHGHRASVVQSGADPDIGHGRVDLSVFQNYAGDVYAVGGHQHPGGEVEIHGWKAQGGPQTLAVGDHVGEGIGVAQEADLGVRQIDTGGGFFGIICFSLIVTVFRKFHNHKAV